MGTNSWKRLTQKQIQHFVEAGAFTTYKGEEILIDPTVVDQGYDKALHFNAQEFFSDEQLESMEWHITSKSILNVGTREESE